MANTNDALSPTPGLPELSLGDRQRLFSRLMAALIVHIYASGYEVTMGECWRSPAVAAANAMKGTGIKNSLHCDRLAVDLNLFKDGKFLTASDDHKPFGEWWEEQHPLCRWGGRFKDRPDGNHYSLEFQGRR